MTIKVSGAFLTRVKLNKRLKRLHKMRDTGVFAIDTAKYSKELQSLHAARQFRNAESKVILANSQKVLIEGSSENNATRSRAVEIRMTCYKAKRLLQETLENTSGYLATRYTTELSHDYKTVNERKAVIKYVLEDFHLLEHKLDTVIGIADMLISDVDKAQWTISNITEVLKLVIARER